MSGKGEISLGLGNASLCSGSGVYGIFGGSDPPSHFPAKLLSDAQPLARHRDLGRGCLGLDEAVLNQLDQVEASDQCLGFDQFDLAVHKLDPRAALPASLDLLAVGPGNL